MMINDLSALQQYLNDHRGKKPSITKLANPTVSQIRDSLPYLTLNLPFAVPHEAMLDEARKLREFFVYHRSGGRHKGWRSLCIHGISSVHTENHDRYGFADRESAGYSYTDISRFCPVTTAFFRDTLGYDSYDRVRFMLLQPGGYILPHEDVDFKRLGPINIALNNPDGCDFVIRDVGIVPFAAGVANMLAVGYEHAVYNYSDQDRYHIIVHGSRGSAWGDYIINSYNSIG